MPRLRQTRRVAACVVGCLLLASCEGDPQVAPPRPQPAASREAPPPGTPSPPAAAPRPSAPAPGPDEPARRQPKPGGVVVLDPGHNGGNAEHPSQINRKVPAGRGASKPCNTTGTATTAGYPEHAFTFDVANRVAATLMARGVRVALTRPDDHGVGPCVDQRAAAGNAAEVAAAVSIHADGSTKSGATGFHIAYSDPPLGPEQGEPAHRLATTLRAGMRDSGLRVADYIGSDGLAARDDLAGLNLATRPAALVECGNMRSPAEAAAMSTTQGRQRYADAIAAGILAYLAG